MTTIKKIATYFLSFRLLISLCGCGNQPPIEVEAGQDKTNFESISSTPFFHNQLLAEADNYLLAARNTTDLGLTLQGEYFYGMAQSSVSALRYAIDIILWLMGEGESLADVTASAPYESWDSIIASGMGSPMPHYFEGLVMEIQGKTEEANACYECAAENPLYENCDYWYLRNMSVDELYQLKDVVLAKELEIFNEYTPRTNLCSTTKTGAEFSPTYHLTLAAQASADGKDQLAWECALNALLTNPTIPELYSAAASYGLVVKAEETLDIVNEGLFAFPDDGALNYLAGALEIAAENKEAAKEFLLKAQSCGQEDIVIKSKELMSQMGIQ